MEFLYNIDPIYIEALFLIGGFYAFCVAVGFGLAVGVQHITAS